MDKPKDKKNDPARDDFNEEQMSTSPVGTPVETDPVKPADEKKAERIPGVASS